MTQHESHTSLCCCCSSPWSCTSNEFRLSTKHKTGTKTHPSISQSASGLHCALPLTFSAERSRPARGDAAAPSSMVGACPVASSPLGTIPSCSCYCSPSKFRIPAPQPRTPLIPFNFEQRASIPSRAPVKATQALPWPLAPTPRGLASSFFVWLFP